MNRLLRIIFPLILCTTGSLISQERYYDIWHFGPGIGLDFRYGAPSQIEGSTTTLEACASICNPRTGELLFYTNGEKVWNSEHRVMRNGEGLFGHLSSTQGALIVPRPGNSLQYYIFTVDALTGGTDTPPSGHGLRYSIVDMSRDSGLGEIVEKNVRLSEVASEKLAGVRHADGKGFWIIVQEARTGLFHAWSLSMAGLDTRPLVSDVGQPYDGEQESGYLKASPNGKMLFAAHFEQNRGALYRFNPRTGEVEALLSTVKAKYGASFSPDNKLLYLSEFNGVHSSTLVQYDVNDATGAANRTVLANVAAAGGAGAFLGMHLAPDGRIYVVRDNNNPFEDKIRGLGVVQEPNVRGVQCNYEPTRITHPARSHPAYHGLQNCIDGFLGESETHDPGYVHADIIRAHDTVICSGELLELQASGGVRYEWSPSTGLSCSDCPNPVASPAQTTTYTAIAFNSVGEARWDSIRVNVLPGPIASAGEDTTICIAGEAHLRGGGGEGYRWSPAIGLSCSDCPNPVAMPGATTIYQVRTWNAAGCESIDSVTVIVREEPEVLHLRVRRQPHSSNGEPFVVPVEIVGEMGSTDITEVDLVLEYDPEVMEINIESLARLLVGTSLEGWHIGIREMRIGRIAVRLTAPIGKALRGGGELLRFESRAYMSNVQGLRITLSTPSQCYTFSIDSEYATPTSGLAGSGIEMRREVSAFPNPAKDRVVFDFNVAGSERTLLEIFDALGMRVGVVVEDRLEAGKHSVEWSVEGIAPGIYWYRLTNGNRRDEGEVLIVK